MCGRFTLKTPVQKIVAAFEVAGDLPLFDQLPPRYNVAPTQPVLAVELREGRRRLTQLRWGLVPAWADSPAVGNRLINARADTVASKPSFRNAFARRRCLVVADGFYEWKKTGKAKQPYYIGVRSGEPFAMAGLAESWQRAGDRVESCTIITTEPNELMAGMHDRMPAILPAADYDLWLDPEFEDRAKLLSLLRPYPADELTAYPVSTLVNSPKNDDPACVISQAPATLF